MMTRFVTLLLAASCLTAVGQVTFCLDGTVWDALDTVRVQCLEDLPTECDPNFGQVYSSCFGGDSTIYVCELSASEDDCTGAFVVLTYAVADLNTNSTTFFNQIFIQGDTIAPIFQHDDGEFDYSTEWSEVANNCQLALPPPPCLSIVDNCDCFAPVVPGCSDPEVPIGSVTMSETIIPAESDLGFFSLHRIWVAIDAAGNESSYHQTIQITDNLNNYVAFEDLNFNGLCDHIEGLGCTQQLACNFNPDANSDDGSCDYSCCPGPGCCYQGLFWDWELGQCFPTNPADINLDGCVQLNDLLDLLSAYGDCGAEESAWQCGDPLEYQGYDYETVEIGEQCWFAENLRAENYENGDAIPASLSDAEWASTNTGAMAVYDENMANLELYGRLYNWYAVDDSRGLCPVGWHVPSDEEWTVMTDELGGVSVAGGKMKETYGWSNDGNGTNSSGFSGLPAGLRNGGGSFSPGDIGNIVYFWSSTEDGLSEPNVFWNRALYSNSSLCGKNTHSATFGFSVRCLKD